MQEKRNNRSLKLLALEIIHNQYPEDEWLHVCTGGKEQQQQCINNM
jgi:hypothetical protein